MAHAHWSLFFLLLALRFFSNIYSGLACAESERDALLRFKSHLHDSFHSLDSWNDDTGANCCAWVGVRCRRNTGHVFGLDLSSMQLSGTISSDLLGLQHLRHLNLSNNTFAEQPIPKFVGSFKHLRHLDLSSVGLNSNFTGVVPHELGNLSNLTHLSLHGLDSCFVDSTYWLSRLTSLQYLDMSSVNLSMSTDWIHVLNELPFIREIYLAYCSLNSIPVHLPHANFTSLTHLDLSGNVFSSSLPKYLLPESLQFIDLTSNNFSLVDQTSSDSYHLEVSVLEALQKLCKLRVLKLGGNNIFVDISDLADVFTGCVGHNLEQLDLTFTGLSGCLPGWIGVLRNLRDLNLESNFLSGPIPKFLRELVNLESLRICSNFLEGVIGEEHLSSLTNLTTLDLSHNPSLRLDVDQNWQPPFQLESIGFSSCMIGPQFPLWLCTQKNLVDLAMASANISDAIPECFGSSFLQQNEKQGKIQTFISKELTFLDLSSNNLSGSIPDFWNGTNVKYLILSDNKLSGEIPNSIFASSLRLLHLQNNNLSGGIPLSSRNSKDLVVLDLSFNSLDGCIPDWLGDSFPNLRILQLKSNKFVGTLPHQLSILSALQILDLSHNDLYGTIPRSFGMFSAMEFPSNYSTDPFAGYGESMWLYIKGSSLDYNYNILQSVISLDLSCNRLYGTIPDELVNLQGLMSLNLSHNNLIGGINKNIDELHCLESLDLSDNKLAGAIPSSLARLNFLGHLNLSYNNFSGKIPFVGQLGAFDSSIYTGNIDLCGFPLPKLCKDVSIINGTANPEMVEQNEAFWFYLGVAPGLVVGFWAVCGTLLIKQSWRTSYFQFVDNMYYAMRLGCLLT